MTDNQTQPTTIIRDKPRDNPYFLMARSTAQDTSLSWAARGVLAYLLSKPDDWIIKTRDLEQQCKRDKVYTILAELEAAGYLSREEVADGKWADGRWRYRLYECPQEQAEAAPCPEIPATDEIVPCPEIPSTNSPRPEKPQHTYKRDLQSRESTPDAGARESSADLELQLILFAILRVTGLHYKFVDGVMEEAQKYRANGCTAEQVAATWQIWRAANQWKLKIDPGRRPNLDEVAACLGQTIGGNAFKYAPEMEVESIIRRVRASGDFATLEPGYAIALEAGHEEVET